MTVLHAPSFNTQNGGEFTPPPAGVFPARLYRIVDMGHQLEVFDGKSNERRKILLSFELLDDTTRLSDGKPVSIHRRFTFSLHPQSALRPFLDSWRGKKMTDAEANTLDFGSLLGLPCLINVTHTERAGRTRADIGSVMPIPRGITAPPGVNPLVLFSATAPDLAILDSFGKTLREAIESSPEFKIAFTPQNRTSTAPATTPQPPAQPNPYAGLRGDTGYRRATPPPPPAMDTDFDDDVPF